MCAPTILNFKSMKFICAFLLWLTVFTLQGQIDYTRDYYPNINMAELYIVEGNYEEALQVYRDAFASVQFSPSIDLYNAAVCALHLGEWSTAKSFLIRIVGRNVEPSFLWKRLEAFQEVLKPHWEVIKAYPKMFSEHEDYRQELYEMEDLDQEFRKGGNADDRYADTIAAIDQQNIKRFCDLVDQYGFPGEHLFGAEKQILNIDFPASIVLRHYFQGLSNGKYTGDDLTDLLETAVTNGELEPNLMAYLLSIQNNQDLKLGGGGIWVFKAGDVDSGYMVEKFTPEQEEMIDQNRVRLGMDPIADYKIKAAFGKTEAGLKSFNFSKYNIVNKISLDKATYERITSGFEPLR